MPAKYEDYEKLQNRSSQYADESSQYSAGATSLSAQVMDAVRKDRASRGISQMSKDVGQTLSQIPTDTAGIRERSGAMINPMQVDVLTAAQRGQNLETLGTAATQSEYNQGTLTDILGEQANKLQAIAQIKAQEAQKAANEAQAIMDKLNYERQQQQDAWNQYVQSQELEQGWAQINKPTGGYGPGISLDFGAEEDSGTASWVPINGNPTSEAPQYTPMAEGETSEDGQWVYKKTGATSSGNADIYKKLAQAAAATGNYAQAATIMAKAEDDKKNMANELKIKNGFNTDMKNINYYDVKDAADRIATADTSSNAGQFTIIYNFIKLLDPATGVKEGEFQNTKAAQSLASQGRALIGRLQNGQTIDPRVAQKFKEETMRIAAPTINKAANIKQRWTDYSFQYGLNPSLLEYDYSSGSGRYEEVK